MSKPKVGIIYLTYATQKWERDIANAMTSLEKVTYPKESLELICVESKSDRPSVKTWFDREWMPKSQQSLPRITYLDYTSEALGFAANNNRGLIKAKELGCDYVYLLNEDAEVVPDFLDSLIARMEADKTIGIAQSLILLGEERNLVNTVGNAYHFLGFGYSRGYKWTVEKARDYFVSERKTNPDLEIAYASGAGMMVRVAALQGEEIFHEPFFLYHEDTDASFMMRLRGYKVVVIPESVIYHWYEFSKSITKFYWMERNRYAVLFMYLKPWTLFLITPLLITMELALALFALARGWWPEKNKVYKELGSAAYQQWIRERRQEIQKRRKISDREFTKFFVAEILFQHDSAKSPLLENIGNPLMKGYWWVVRNLM